MALSFRQFRYYKDNSSQNFPVGLTAASLISGDALNTYLPIQQIGIQALPGTKFYINGATNVTVVGSTGLVELDISNGGSISSIMFNRESLELISQNTEAYIILDIIYRQGEEG